MTHRASLFVSTLIFSSSLVIGCSDDKGGDGGITPKPDATPTSDSGVHADATTMIPDIGPRPDGGTIDTGVMMGDGNDTFEEAVTIAIDDMNGGTGAINPAGDVDFFKFEGTAGEWLIIDTDANPDDTPGMVDTAITLYDSTQTQIADNDDSVPRVNVDSEIIIRLPTTGTYYVKIQEWSTWCSTPASPGGCGTATPDGMPSFTYTMFIGTVAFMNEGVNQDPENGNDAASAAPLELNANEAGFTFGDFADSNDVDVFKLAITGTSTRSVTTVIMPSGVNGYGSTTDAGFIWITDEFGTATSTAIAKIEAKAGLNEIQPPLVPGNYLLWLDHAGTAGANDFYMLKTFVGDGNPPEINPTTNDTIAGSGALMQSSSGTGSRSGFVMSMLDDGDVDYFMFQTLATETISIACGSASNGSGVVDMLVEIRDAGDATIPNGSQTETPLDGIFLDDIASPTVGTHYLRLSKASQNPMVTGNWVQCGVHTSVP